METSHISIGILEVHETSKTFMALQQRTCLPTLTMSPKFCHAINLGKKWWQIILEREISCNQWEGATCIHERSSLMV
jgi:hypothetical protein